MPFCSREQQCLLNEGGVQGIVVPGPGEFICAGTKEGSRKEAVILVVMNMGPPGQNRSSTHITHHSTLKYPSPFNVFLL